MALKASVFASVGGAIGQFLIGWQKAIREAGGGDEEIALITDEQFLKEMAQQAVAKAKSAVEPRRDPQERIKALIAGTGCGTNFYLDTEVKDSNLPDEVEGEDAEFKEMTTQSRRTAEIFDEVMEEGRPMASPQALLERYAKAHPSAGKDHPVAVIWQKNGQWFYAVLGWVRGQQNVGVSRSGARNGWGESCRFLVHKPCA